MQKLPIGKSDFKSIIEDGFYYVDKTLIIQEIIQNSSDVILIPRPRRFGKTVALNTLQYFFENKEKNECLFEKLLIYKEKEFKQHFGKYPVIYLTFKDIKGANFKISLSKIKNLIVDECWRHHDVINQSYQKLTKRQILSYENILYKKAMQDEYESSLRLLSKLLTIVYNKKCVILIDEYDTPIQTGYIKNYYDEIIDFFKTFLGGGLKDNDKNCYKAVITGILRISKESIFSDLNNIDVFTLLDQQFSDKFGFTTQEIKQILQYYHLAQNFQEVNKWYNGYKIGNTTIFNPWSILNYVNRREFNTYWANTSSNDIIRTLVENSDTFREDIEILLVGGSVEKVIDPNITFQHKNFNFNEKILYSFLFLSGYLKCNHKILYRGKYLCQLSIVNRECLYIFEDIIIDWLDEAFTNRKLRLMLKSLIEADLPLFERIFSEFVRDTLSYFDTAKKIESVYHAFLLGLLVNLNEYEILSNKESGYGRFDIMILHKKDKTKPAIVMELKTINKFKEETKKKALKSALKQIEEKEYEAEAIKKGYVHIVKFGVVFHKKRVWIKKA